MNLQSKSDAELRAEKAAILREQSKRRRAAKPKQRKVRDASEVERARAYVSFLRDRCDHCWICGCTAKDRPAWWTAPVFMVERMHIVNKPRVEDVRAIIAACSLCHRVQHGDRFPNGQKPLTMAELLGVKLDNDPDTFDMEFLQRHSVQRLPEPDAPAPREVR